MQLQQRKFQLYIRGRRIWHRGGQTLEEGLWDLRSWRHLEFNCQGLEQLDLSWPCSEQDIGPGDLRDSFKTELLYELR